MVVDNNDAGEDVFTQVFKQIKGLLRKKVRNPAAQQVGCPTEKVNHLPL